MAIHEKTQSAGVDVSPSLALEGIRQALSNLQFGTVTVVVQDGVVVQVERTEKIRVRTL